MSECPYCQAHVEESAIFCRACGASLRLPEYDRAFCPHCGARVSIRQEFCHECHWSLVKSSAEGPAPVEEPPAPILAKPSPWKNPWVWGLLVGAGLIIVLLPWLFISGSPSHLVPETTAPKVAGGKSGLSAPTPAPPISGPSPGVGAAPPAGEAPSTDAVLKNQLAEVLNQLREAQLKKDITQYVRAYSPDFPNFDQRRQKTLAVWGVFDYSSLDFELKEAKPLDADHAFAQVTWNIKTEEKKTQNSKTLTQTYKVWFTKDSGQWRINKLELVHKSG